MPRPHIPPFCGGISFFGMFPARCTISCFAIDIALYL